MKIATQRPIAAMPDIHRAVRYVVPLKEGGSLPAVVDTGEAGLFVVKFRGAGQGARALVAEILVAGLARTLELAVPELALIELDEEFGRAERDPEIRDILRGSVGLNVGLRYLDGAFNFDPLADPVDPEWATRVVWLDALVTNLDRTPRNPNLLSWHGRNWLIDHGAALYFHHDWSSVDEKRARDPFALIRDHVLLPWASGLESLDRELAGRLSPGWLEAMIDEVPDELLMDRPPGIEPPFSSPRENRRAYLQYFERRLAAPRAFVDAAVRARAEEPAQERKGYRR